MKWIYKTTYPNGESYVGKDLTGSETYFGSPSRPLIAVDFTFDQIRDFSIRRELLWRAEGFSDAVVTAKEVELIRKYNSNDPTGGYNHWLKFRSKLNVK